MDCRFNLTTPDGQPIAYCKTCLPTYRFLKDLVPNAKVRLGVLGFLLLLLLRACG